MAYKIHYLTLAETFKREETWNKKCINFFPSIRNDHSGCLQTTGDKCSKVLSTFHKWGPYVKGPDGRVSGPVCGQVHFLKMNFACFWDSLCWSFKKWYTNVSNYIIAVFIKWKLFLQVFDPWSFKNSFKLNIRIVLNCAFFPPRILGFATLRLLCLRTSGLMTSANGRFASQCRSYRW